MNDFGPKEKKPVMVKVDVLKLWRLLQRLARRKSEAKRCGKSVTKTSTRNE